MPPNTKPPATPKHPPQDVPKAITEVLLEACKGFYGDDFKRFMQDRRFLLRMVVFAPARWFTGRGVSFPPDRYQKIVLDVLKEAKVHCQGEVKFWPAYLAKCVQSHFAVHGEKYYDEAKGMRTLAERAMQAAALAGKTVVAAPDPIRELAQASRLLAGPKRRKQSKEVAVQTSLPGL